MECTLAFPSCMNLEIFLCHWICECDVSCNYGWKHLLPDFKAWPPSLPPCASVQCPAQPPWVPPAVPQGQGHQCHHAVIALVTPPPSNRDNDNKTVPHWWHHCVYGTTVPLSLLATPCNKNSVMWWAWQQHALGCTTTVAWQQWLRWWSGHATIAWWQPAPGHATTTTQQQQWKWWQHSGHAHHCTPR